jgi:hypothetical protein
MQHLKIPLNAEIRYLVQEALRLDAQLKILPETSNIRQRLKREQQYHHQELGQHLVWAFQEQE